MDHFKKYKQNLAIIIFLSLFLPVIAAAGSYLALLTYTELGQSAAILISVITYIAGTLLAYLVILSAATKPTGLIWQAVWHVSPDKTSVAAPELNNIRLGKEMVSALIMQIYNLASSKPSSQESDKPTMDMDLLENIPLAVIFLDRDRNVIKLNQIAGTLADTQPLEAAGKNIYEILNLSFKNEDTLDIWLNSLENKVTDTHLWEHVKLNLSDNTTKHFDMAASYSKDSASGGEIVLAIFEKTQSYQKEEQATSYVAMAVHELRTPLTMLRGYIEIFEDELSEELDEEHKEFMRKMSVAAQNLTAFVNNILNVARIDENQFSLTLREYSWHDVLVEIIDSLKLKTEIRGKKVSLNIDSDLPAVGIDKISMYEVVTNLVDNAIKYSGQENNIIISSKLGKDGAVETTVEDKGPGIPESVVGQLFTKYYRSHRSKNAIGGSGLGLYLVKSLVKAHGGDVWVESKEGHGSKFGFSILPYSKVSEGVKLGSQDGIERHANGWIKNHSLYRR